MIRRSILIGTLAVSLVSTAAHADALQNQLTAAAKAGRSDLYAFRRTLTFERTGAARKVIVEQFDPRRPAADRWSLVSIDGRAPTDKERADSHKVKRGPVPSYSELAEWIGAPATRADGPPGYILYRYPRLPANTLKINSHDASPDTRAEALVNVKGKTPFVERIRFVSTKGFRMMLVVSLQSMTINGRYRQLPDGQFVPADNSSDIAGSMMGKAGTMHTATTYSDFQRVR